MERKIIIIGSSIAGASAACLLAKHCDVVVYEQKAQKEIGKKLCANVYTSSFLKYAKLFELNPNQFITLRFDKAVFISPKNRLSLKTKEFKVDRQKFLNAMIKKAQENGAKFNFKTEFVSFEKKRNYVVKLRKGNKLFTDSCDILIGADGALSKVAEKAGLWENRKFILAMHTEVPSGKFKKFKLEKKAYYIFLEKSFGYYSYIFPYKNRLIIGTGDRPELAKKCHLNFLGFLGVKKGKIRAALIPEPEVIKQKNDLFLIGDAGCHVKFSGGGVIPAIIAAEAVKEIILNKNFRKMKELQRRTFINKIAAKIILKMKEKDFDYLLEVLKDRKFSGLVVKRDEFEKSEYKKLLDLRILKLLFKLF